MSLDKETRAAPCCPAVLGPSSERLQRNRKRIWIFWRIQLQPEGKLLRAHREIFAKKNERNSMTNRTIEFFGMSITSNARADTKDRLAIVRAEDVVRRLDYQPKD